MPQAFLCDARRTAFGRLNGALAPVRPDDMAALVIRDLLSRHPHLNPETIDDVVLGCANQAGEDNRNVARMALLLAGVPVAVPGVTVNRLCGSSLDALAWSARAIKSGEMDLLIAGGVESMSRAPFVMGKAQSAYSRAMQLEDTTMGWRFINPALQAEYGTESMPQTAENLAQRFSISREDQDKFALRSQQLTARAQHNGFYQPQITPVTIPAVKRGQQPQIFDQDEHPRATSLEALSQLKPVVHSAGTITAGNASGLNDGACALLLASEAALDSNQLTPQARIVASAVSGVQPTIMGYGPVGAITKVLSQARLTLKDMDTIEINEAFAAQVLSVTRALGLSDDDERINPNGGAIALGHPLGTSGGRVVMNAMWQLKATGGRYALCAMCIGVGQGIAMIIERV
ncbi:acetyl-CoA acetyltransferase [Salmonella enterica subsp. enterica serovar Choleraesuis]|nr:acetyl-CoA acetyltransferase [Salmonella enterica subsp. enterica serovar Choleraesuis]